MDVLANALLHLLDPRCSSLWGLALVAVALARGRPRVALAVALVMALAPLTAETAEAAARPPHVPVAGRLIAAASWPSGHSTAALALVLCAVLVAPRRLRPLVAVLGAAFAAAVGCSLLILAWHMPSDVLGGYLVAALWTALAVAGLRAAERAGRGSLSGAQDCGAVSEPCAPGSHSGSDPPLGAVVRSFAARLRMNSRSERRFR